MDIYILSTPHGASLCIPFVLTPPSLPYAGTPVRCRLLVGAGGLHFVERLPLGGASLAQPRGGASLQAIFYGEPPPVYVPYGKAVRRAALVNGATSEEASSLCTWYIVLFNWRA